MENKTKEEIKQFLRYGSAVVNPDEGIKLILKALLENAGDE